MMMKWIKDTRISLEDLEHFRDEIVELVRVELYRLSESLPEVLKGYHLAYCQNQLTHDPITKVITISLNLPTLILEIRWNAQLETTEVKLMKQGGQIYIIKSYDSLEKYPELRDLSTWLYQLIKSDLIFRRYNEIRRKCL